MQFSHTIRLQTNLAAEGIHLAIFNRNFAGWKHRLGFPVPIILTSSMLVESFERGACVSEYTQLYNSRCKREQGLLGTIVRGITLPARALRDAVVGWALQDKGQVVLELHEQLINSPLAHFIVTCGEDLYLKMLLVDNLMHADFHPGNIMIQEMTNKGVQSDEARIVLVDAGMVARLTVTEQEHFIGLLEAMGEGLGREAAHHVTRFSANQQYSPAQRSAFADSMENLFEEKCRGYHTGIHLGEVLRGLLTLVRVHRITIEANYATLMMNAMCLDGLATQLIPGYNVIDGAKSLLRYHRRCNRALGKTAGQALFQATLPLSFAAKARSDRRLARSLAKGVNLHHSYLVGLGEGRRWKWGKTALGSDMHTHMVCT